MLSLFRILTVLATCALSVVAQVPSEDGSTPLPLPGDLFKGITSPTGQLIADIILGKESAISLTKGPRPGPLACLKNPCCKWYTISDALTLMFKGPTGRCNDNARAAIRLGFHDAGTWSSSLAAQGNDFGGADGSIYLFGETSRAENNGLQSIATILGTLAKVNFVGVGDMIQFAATHATVTCPLGPRVRTFVGRKDATKAAPNGLLPDVHSPANDLITLFADKRINPTELAALVGAHSASKQFFVNTTRRGAPQDSTPGVWDVKFYGETLEDNPPQVVFKFPSDVALSQHPAIAEEWREFAQDQSHWNRDYASAYVRLSMAGVNNINTGLTECTDALPQFIPSFAGSDDSSGISQ